MRAKKRVWKRKEKRTSLLTADTYFEAKS